MQTVSFTGFLRLFCLHSCNTCKQCHLQVFYGCSLYIRVTRANSVICGYPTAVLATFVQHTCFILIEFNRVGVQPSWFSLSVCLSVCLSICLSVCLSLSLHQPGKVYSFSPSLWIDLFLDVINKHAPLEKEAGETPNASEAEH